MSISISERLARGPATSKELQAATGLSQPAVSRQLHQMGKTVIKLPKGRSPLYVMTKNAFGADDNLPLYMVDPHGNNVIVANIRPLSRGGFFIESLAAIPGVLLGKNGNGYYDDLPYFLDDLRPQGFLGRQIAEQMSQISSYFPHDPRHWSADHVGRFLVSNGDDLPGNLKFGPLAHLRVRRRPDIVSIDDYPNLAEEVLRGNIPGSSAGGEQPKFTAYNDDRGHVIVKFSPNTDDPIANRWRDILITEYHASATMHAFDFPAAENKLFEVGGRLFLESQRFDRNGEHGRLPMISLQAVDAEFTGIGTNWPVVFDALVERELIHPQHAYDAKILWYFGRLINNTDMHLGNISLSIEDDEFCILPIYDMCSMGFAPRGGEISPYYFSPPLSNGNLPTLPEESEKVAQAMAQSFWEHVANDQRISKEFRDFLKQGNSMR